MPYSSKRVLRSPADVVCYYMYIVLTTSMNNNTYQVGCSRLRAEITMIASRTKMYHNEYYMTTLHTVI